MAWTDAELVRRTRAGDREAFGVLVERHRRTIYVLALQKGLQAAEAEDVAQEVFLKAYRGLEGFRGASRFSTWLYSIASHHCLSALARRSRTATSLSFGGRSGAGGRIHPPRWIASRTGRRGPTRSWRDGTWPGPSRPNWPSSLKTTGWS